MSTLQIKCFIQKTLYFDIALCYNKLDILYTGDKVEFTSGILGKNEKRFKG